MGATSLGSGADRGSGAGADARPLAFLADSRAFFMAAPFSVTTETLSTHRNLAPGPWRLTLVTNPDDCNLSCPMCECGAARRPGPPRRMDPALATRVLREAAAMEVAEVIPSTLGEPLLWAGLDALVDLCAELGVALNVTTNGTFPGRGPAAWAARLVPVASDVKVSWNGATARTAEAIMPGLDFGAAVEGVRALVAARDAHARGGGRRCRVSFQVTAQEGNVDELPAVVSLAAALGVDRVKVNQLQLRFPSLAPLSLRRDVAALRRWNAAAAATRAAAEAARLPGGGRVVLENVAPLAEDPAAPAPAGPCRFVGREAWIHADGRFAPCPHPAAARGELGDFGGVADRPLAAVWDDVRFRAFVARYDEHPVCRTCPLRRPGGA
jgi:MoaA/NifB/PqqE/SkfB family radical SAM enzyme